MSGLLPAAVYGLTVPNGDVMIPASAEFPAAFRITMAAIDPSAEPEFAGSVIDGTTPRATLKIVRQPLDEEDEDDSDYDEDDEDNLRELLGLGSDDEDDDDEDESSEEEANGGPSDPSKSKKAKQAAMLQKLKAALEEEGSDEDMDDAPNGVAVKNNKGKAPATGEESDSDDEESIDLEMEEFVLCTLDPAQHYQQPLDIVVGENEKVFFKVTGTHAIFLTGNYVIPVDDSPRGDDERDMMYPEDDEEDYDLSPDEDELDMDGESDDLDDIDDPRITELGTDDDEQVPQLVKKEKGSKKRAAPESDDEPTLDSVMDKALKPAAEEPKLSKKQMKKLKNNAGEAIKSDTKVDTESPSSKKVQFAKNLEQGPTGSKLDTTAKTNGEKADKAADKPKSALGVKTVKGVTVDDKKLGSGPAAKKGNKVSMRYIGKLTDGKVFDSNKKGKPFTFKLGAGEVIQGWDFGIEGITAGGERRITVPSKLAYGKQKLPGIPANSDLVFDVKCLSIA